MHRTALAQVQGDFQVAALFGGDHGPVQFFFGDRLASGRRQGRADELVNGLAGGVGQFGAEHEDTVEVIADTDVRPGIAAVGGLVEAVEIGADPDPGQHQGNPVRVQYVLPFKFKLE